MHLPSKWPHQAQHFPPYVKGKTRFVVKFDSSRKLVSMGSYGNRWLQCAWCWRWGKCTSDEGLDGAEPLWDIDCLGGLCGRCIELEEPPWWPNNRQCCAMWLVGMRLLPYRINSEGVAVDPAKFLAENVPFSMGK